MFITCSCPAAATLPNIGEVNCKETLGQIQRVAFQRVKDGDNFNEFTTAKKIDLKASWVELLGVSTSKRIVLSPIIENPTNEPGEAITFGSDNEVPDGIPYTVGMNPTTFTGVLRGVPQTTIKQIKQLQCEAANGGLGVYLFDNRGQIKALKGSGVDTYRPIPIRSLSIQDLALGGLSGIDSNAISWSFLPGWSDDTVNIVASDFSPVHDLQNVVIS